MSRLLLLYNETVAQTVCAPKHGLELIGNGTKRDIQRKIHRLTESEKDTRTEAESEESRASCCSRLRYLSVSSSVSLFVPLHVCMHIVASCSLVSSAILPLYLPSLILRFFLPISSSAARRMHI